MRRDLLGLILSLTDNNLMFLSSTNLKYSYKYILLTNTILLFYLQFFNLNSLAHLTTLNEFTANENFLLANEAVMAFILSYYFVLPSFNVRLCLSTWISKNSVVKSATGLFSNLNWPEREVSEMYGIHFIDKLDARHLLLDYNFFQFPMLSTFPMGGYQEVIYNFIKKALEYTKLGQWDGKRAVAKAN